MLFGTTTNQQSLFCLLWLQGAPCGIPRIVSYVLAGDLPRNRHHTCISHTQTGVRQEQRQYEYTALVLAAVPQQCSPRRDVCTHVIQHATSMLTAAMYVKNNLHGTGVSARAIAPPTRCSCCTRLSVLCPGPLPVCDLFRLLLLFRCFSFFTAELNLPRVVNFKRPPGVDLITVVIKRLCSIRLKV